MKRSLLFIITLVSVFSAYAQFSIGVKAGLNVSSTTSPDIYDMLNEDDLSSRVGPTVGVFAQYRVSDLFGVQAEANYSLRGFSDKFYLLDSNGIGNYYDNQVDYLLSYVDIPVLAKLYPISGTGFCAFAGPQVSLLVGHNAKNGTFEHPDLHFPGYGHYNTFDCSVVFGAAYEFSRFVVDARYNLGLCQTFKNQDHFQNRSFALSIGYKF